MTREQIIKQAANKYLDNYVPDICGMCEEDIWDAFIAGAEWANKHPDLSQVWHPASEPPQEIDAQIICNAASLTCPEGMTYVETTLRAIMHISSSWQDWARRCRLKAWAYLDDLLPLQAVWEFRATHRKNRIVGNFRAQLLSKIK